MDALVEFLNHMDEIGEYPAECVDCEHFETVYDYPMGEYEGFGSVCCGETCTCKGECKRGIKG